MSQIPTSSAAVDIALVGCGFMGRRHIAGYAALAIAGFRTARLSGVMDLDPDAAVSAADEAERLLGTRPAVYTSLGALLADDRIAAVDIVTDPRTHAPIAVAAAEAGRHILCEKPLALTIRRARAMVDAAEANGVLLGTAENYRRGGANRLAKAVIDSGVLGRIHLLREFHTGGDDRVIISRWRHLKRSGSIGLDMSIHYADIVEYLMGPVDRVWGRGIIAEPIRYAADGSDPLVVDGEDGLFAGMVTRSGVDVQFTYLPSGPGGFHERTVHGSLGTLEVPPDRSDGDVVLRLRDRTLVGDEVAPYLGDRFELDEVTLGVLGAAGNGGKGAPWPQVDAGHLAVEIHDFAEAVLAGHAPEVDGLGGMRALAVVHAILESGVAHREVSVDEVLNGELHAYQDDIDLALDDPR